jgi:hypothetical protein
MKRKILKDKTAVVYLTESQKEWLRKSCQENNIAMSAFLRDCMVRNLGYMKKKSIGKQDIRN